ncbi:unnamed protein product, partial [Allacma fusca]
ASAAVALDVEAMTTFSAGGASTPPPAPT